MKVSIDASSKSELQAVLACTDIRVPGRTEGRRNFHCENWTICRFLSGISDSSLLSFPLSLTPREGPDFKLTFDNETIAGIEITESTHQDYAWARAIAATIPGAIIEPSLFKPGNIVEKHIGQKPPVSNISRGLYGLPWRGYSVEREWLTFISHSIDSKTRVLAEPDFTRFTNDWLLIYDNTPSFALIIEKAMEMLTASLQDYWHQGCIFSSLFILSGNYVMRFNPSYSEAFPVIDLWQTE